jgi:hypothetical protein
MGPTLPPIQWVPGALSQGIKRPGRESLVFWSSISFRGTCCGVKCYNRLKMLAMAFAFRCFGISVILVQSHLLCCMHAYENWVCHTEGSMLAAVHSQGLWRCWITLRINRFLDFILLTYSVALVRKRTILTERPPLVGEVSASFCG